MPVTLVLAYWTWLIAGPVFAVIAISGLIIPTLAPLVLVAGVLLSATIPVVALALLDDVLKAVNQ